MPRHRNVTRLEEISLSSIVQSCSLACTRLEQEDGLSGTAVEDPANTPDIAPVSSNSQVSLVCVINLYRLEPCYKLLNWESLSHITIFILIGLIHAVCLCPTYKNTGNTSTTNH